MVDFIREKEEMCGICKKDRPLYDVGEYYRWCKECKREHKIRLLFYGSELTRIMIKEKEDE
jgi:hypothetical protein